MHGGEPCEVEEEVEQRNPPPPRRRGRSSPRWYRRGRRSQSCRRSRPWTWDPGRRREMLTGPWDLLPGTCLVMKNCWTELRRLLKVLRKWSMEFETLRIEPRMLSRKSCSHLCGRILRTRTQRSRFQQEWRPWQSFSRCSPTWLTKSSKQTSLPLTSTQSRCPSPRTRCWRGATGNASAAQAPLDSSTLQVRRVSAVEEDLLRSMSVEFPELRAPATVSPPLS